MADELATVPQKAASTSVLGSYIAGSNAVDPTEAYVPPAKAEPMHQVTTASAAGAAFRWVGDVVSPAMFANADSTLLFAVPVVASKFDPVANYALLGMCQSFNFNIGTRVFTYKELRGEHTIIIPQKSDPGSMSITRMLGGCANFNAAVAGGSCWAWDNQSRVNKQLFGIMAVYLNTPRESTLGGLYFERCAIRNNSSGMQKGEFILYESIDIVFDRVIDSVSNANIGAKTPKAGTFSSGDAQNSKYYVQFGQAGGATTADAGPTAQTATAPTRWTTSGKTL